jgi:hypothetical protein
VPLPVRPLIVVGQGEGRSVAGRRHPGAVAEDQPHQIAPGRLDREGDGLGGNLGDCPLGQSAGTGRGRAHGAGGVETEQEPGPCMLAAGQPHAQGDLTPGRSAAVEATGGQHGDAAARDEEVAVQGPRQGVGVGQEGERMHGVLFDGRRFAAPGQ